MLNLMDYRKNVIDLLMSSTTKTGIAICWLDFFFLKCRWQIIGKISAGDLCLLMLVIQD